MMTRLLPWFKLVRDYEPSLASRYSTPFSDFSDQVCCVAPERFYKHRAQQEDLMDEPRGELTPAMDIFSLGCVFIELFTDGKFPFKLSDIYKYKEGDLDRPPQLQEIADEGDLHRSSIAEVFWCN